LLDRDMSFSGLDPVDLFSAVEAGPKFTEFVIRTPKKDVTDALGRKVFRGRQTRHLPCEMFDDEKRFYDAVTEFIRTGFKALERHSNDAQRKAAGFLLTTFQKLNGSSTAAIRNALSKRLERLQGVYEKLPPDDPEPEEIDDRYEGEFEEEQVLRSDRQIVAGEIEVLQALLACKVKRDRKQDELVRLIDHIATESPRQDEEKVLIFTE
jgi:hypothetical protein